MVTKRALLAMTSFAGGVPQARMDQALLAQLVEELEDAAARDTAAGEQQQWYRFEPRSAGLRLVYGVEHAWQSSGPLPLATAVAVLFTIKPRLLQYVLDDLLFFGRVSALQHGDDEHVDLAALFMEHMREESARGEMFVLAPRGREADPSLGAQAAYRSAAHAHSLSQG
jgi:hypothetical protein